MTTRSDEHPAVSTSDPTPCRKRIPHPAPRTQLTNQSLVQVQNPCAASKPSFIPLPKDVNSGTTAPAAIIMLCAGRVPVVPVHTTAAVCGTAVESSLGSAGLPQWSQTQAYASNIYYSLLSQAVALDSSAEAASSILSTSPESWIPCVGRANSSTRHPPAFQNLSAIGKQIYGRQGSELVYRNQKQSEKHEGPLNLTT